MSTTFDNVFILGATSGLGEALARRCYQDGKKIMISGRRQERLQALQKEMPGVETIQIDVEDLKAFPKKVAEVTRRFSDIDQIILMAGSGSVFDFKDISSSSDTHIASEIATNVTFPMIASRLIVPFLISRDQPAQIVLVSSGLAFVPFPIYPVYCPAKAAVHYFACTLRGQLADTPITVTELIPPYVDTDFDKNFRAQLMERTGGKLKAMPLDEFTEEAYKGLQDRSDGKPKKEVGVGTAATRAGIWWDAFRPVFEQYGVSTMNS